MLQYTSAILSLSKYTLYQYAKAEPQHVREHSFTSQPVLRRPLHTSYRRHALHQKFTVQKFFLHTLTYLIRSTMAAPQAAPRPVPEKWQCHICLEGPMLYATSKACTGVKSDGSSCGHKIKDADNIQCSLCKLDNDIPPPLTSKAPRGPPPSTVTDRLPPSHLGTNNLVAGPRPKDSASRSRDKHKHKHPTNRPGPSRRAELGSAPPAMKNWWRCCHCQYVNNPAWGTRCVGGSCTTQHFACRYCTSVAPVSRGR